MLRRWLFRVCLISNAFLLVGAPHNPAPYAAFGRPLPKTERYLHALDRLTFGPRPGDLDHIRKIGINKWLDGQLDPERIPEDPNLTLRLKPYVTVGMSAQDLWDRYPAHPGEAANVVVSDLTEARLLRAIYSTHQLEELMVDFWYNHFNVYIGKGADRFLVPTYERESIRPYVFGKFYDLLLATAKSPAMLVYLDNAESIGADSPAGRNRKRGLNENYGRELMELHTLGAQGGYTQQDVINVARCFTGWTLAPPRLGGAFEYNDRMHDKGHKVVLGQVIPAGGGMDDGLRVLKLLAGHPSTARLISRELAQRFVADDPPPSLLNRMSDAYLKSDGDIRTVLRTMFHSPEFWSQGAYRAKIKMPLELVVSAARAMDVDVRSPFALIAELQRLGEPLYRKIEPTGYNSLNQEWISSSELLERMNFGVAIGRGNMPGLIVNTTAATLDTIQDRNLRQQLAGTGTPNSPGDPGFIAGLLLGSPEFQRH